MIHKLLYLFFIVFALHACSSSDNIEDVRKEEIEEIEKPKLEFSSSPVEIDGVDSNYAEDIPYGPHDKNKFDIFMPKSDKPVPLVIYIHGGYFVSIR